MKVYRSALKSCISLPAAMALLLAIGVCLQTADAGLDLGLFEIAQYEEPASGWMFVPDATSDGTGVQYLAFTSSYVHAGPSNPSVSSVIQYAPGQSASSLQEFIAWIVANNPHVNSAAELTVHKMEVSTVLP